MPSELSSLYAFTPAGGRSELAGRLDWRPDAGTFTYAPAWLESPQAYAVDPRNLPRAPQCLPKQCIATWYALMFLWQ